MALPVSSEKPIAAFLLKSAGVGVVLFWLVGVWLLPEKATVLKNFRVYMAAGVVPITIGAYVYEKLSVKTKKIGSWITAFGFCCAGAFFAMSFYLFVSVCCVIARD